MPLTNWTTIQPATSKQKHGLHKINWKQIISLVTWEEADALYRIADAAIKRNLVIVTDDDEEPCWGE